MKIRVFGLAFALMLTCSSSSLSAELPGIAAKCFTCHGESGIPEGNQIPVIAGIGTFYLENQMLLFAEEGRPCEIDYLPDRPTLDKCKLIGAIPEEDQMSLASYFGELEFSPRAETTDPELVEQGAKIHEERCMLCHTDNGREVMEDAAILSGQPKAYLARQLQHFVSGERWQPPSMERQTKDLTPDQIEALAHFYADDRP